MDKEFYNASFNLSYNFLFMRNITPLLHLVTMPRIAPR